MEANCTAIREVITNKEFLTFRLPPGFLLFWPFLTARRMNLMLQATYRQFTASRMSSWSPPSSLSCSPNRVIARTVSATATS